MEEGLVFLLGETATIPSWANLIGPIGLTLFNSMKSLGVKEAANAAALNPYSKYFKKFK